MMITKREKLRKTIEEQKIIFKKLEKRRLIKMVAKIF